MVTTIMPLTKLKANPKNRFGSYLHVAVRYGQFEIFKIIFKHLKEKKFDWLQLKVNTQKFPRNGTAWTAKSNYFIPAGPKLKKE